MNATMPLPLSDPDASVWVKGVSAMDILTFVAIIVATVIANVISEFVIDWLKQFFKDND